MAIVFSPSAVSQMNYSQADGACEGRVGSPVQVEATEMPVLLAGLLCHHRRACGFNGSPAPLVLNLSLLQMPGQRIREPAGHSRDRKIHLCPSSPVSSQGRHQGQNWEVRSQPHWPQRYLMIRFLLGTECAN